MEKQKLFRLPVLVLECKSSGALLFTIPLTLGLM